MILNLFCGRRAFRTAPRSEVLLMLGDVKHRVGGFHQTIGRKKPTGSPCSLGALQVGTAKLQSATGSSVHGGGGIELPSQFNKAVRNTKPRRTRWAGWRLLGPDLS